VALGALRKRGFIDDHPDTIRLRTPRRALPALLTPGLWPVSKITCGQ
jgi:hypothetical protein